jgi:hypothetical protein
MSQKRISTADLVALTNESQKLITPSVRDAFARAATREESDFDRVSQLDITALREEATVARPSLKDDYKRLLCMTVIERTEHGLRVAMRGMLGGEANEMFARAKTLDGARNMTNERRANLYAQIGAHHIAEVLRKSA